MVICQGQGKLFDTSTWENWDRKKKTIRNSVFTIFSFPDFQFWFVCQNKNRCLRLLKNLLGNQNRGFGGFRFLSFCPPLFGNILACRRSCDMNHLLKFQACQLFLSVSSACNEIHAVLTNNDWCKAPESSEQFKEVSRCQIANEKEDRQCSQTTTLKTGTSNKGRTGN